MKQFYLMDFSKIQCDIIKNINHVNDYQHGSAVIDGIQSKMILIKEHCAVFIPKSLYYLNDETVFHDKMPVSDKFVECFVTAANESLPITLMDELKAIPECKKPLRIFKNGDETIYINTTYLDVFKTAVDINFKGTKAKNPIFIYSGDTFIGIVMPVNVRR